MNASTTLERLRHQEVSPVLLRWMEKYVPTDQLVLDEPARFRKLPTQVRARERLLLLEAGVKLAAGAPRMNAVRGLRSLAQSLGFSERRLEHVVTSQTGCDLKTLKAHAMLGVATDASERTIRKKFRKLARRVHPDRVSHLAPEFQVLAQKRMAALNAARDLLRTTDVALEPDEDDIELPEDEDDIELLEEDDFELGEGDDIELDESDDIELLGHEGTEEKQEDDVQLTFASIDDDIEL